MSWERMSVKVPVSFPRFRGGKVDQMKRRNSLRNRNRIIFSVNEDEDEEIHNQWTQEKGLPVTCGDKRGFLDAKKLDRGKQCIWCEGQWLSPSAFEEFAGKGSSKKWKMTIYHEEKPLQVLFDKGILTTKGFKRRGTETTKTKKILSSNKSESEKKDDKDDDSEELGTQDRVEESESGGEGGGSGDDDDDDEEEEMTNVPKCVKNTWLTVKVVVQRLQEGKSNCTRSEHPEQDSQCDQTDKARQSEDKEKRNSSTTHQPLTAAVFGSSDIYLPQASDVPHIKEESEDEFMQSDERTKTLTEIKTEIENSPSPLSATDASCLDIKPLISTKTEHMESISDHDVNFWTSTGSAGDKTDELENYEEKIKKDFDMSTSDTSIRTFVITGDFDSSEVIEQCGAEETSTGATNCSSEFNLGPTGDPHYLSDMEEGPSSSANTDLDTLDLDQLKREKIKMQLKVLKLQEEYYTLKIMRFTK